MTFIIFCLHLLIFFIFLSNWRTFQTYIIRRDAFCLNIVCALNVHAILSLRRLVCGRSSRHSGFKRSLLKRTFTTTFFSMVRIHLCVGARFTLVKLPKSPDSSQGSVGLAALT